MSGFLAAARVLLRSLSAVDWSLFLGGLVFLSASVIAYEAVCLVRRRGYPVVRNVLLALALIWWLYVIYMLTLSGRFDHGTGIYLVPFMDWLDAEGLRGTKAAFSLLNVLLFMPIGFLVSLFLPRRRRVLVALLVCAMASVGIELLQYALQVGDVETEDVIFNVFGAFLGCLLAKPFQIIKHDKSHRFEDRKTEGK